MHNGVLHLPLFLIKYNEDKTIKQSKHDQNPQAVFFR